MTDFHGNEAKKNSKMADSKKLSFSKLPILMFLWKFHRLVGHFGFKKKLLHRHENQSKLLGYQGWVDILMIALVYSKRVSVRTNLLHSVNVFLLMMISIYYARKMYQYKQIHRNCVFSKFKILHSFFTASCFANLKHR